MFLCLYLTHPVISLSQKQHGNASSTYPGRDFTLKETVTCLGAGPWLFSIHGQLCSPNSRLDFSSGFTCAAYTELFTVNCIVNSLASQTLMVCLQRRPTAVNTVFPGTQARMSTLGWVQASQLCRSHSVSAYFCLFTSFSILLRRPKDIDI